MLVKSCYGKRNKNKINYGFHIKHKKDFLFSNCLSPENYVGVIFKKEPLHIGFSNFIEKIYGKRRYVLKRIENSSLCIFCF